MLLVWSLSHHLLAGIRHLLLDIDIGVEKTQARGSAWLVNMGALALTASLPVEAAVSRAAQGLRAWLLQRITAVYLAIYIVVTVVYLLSREMVDFSTWHNWLASPWMGVATTLFTLALLLHVWVGIRDVLIDYVHRGKFAVAVYGGHRTGTARQSCYG